MSLTLDPATVLPEDSATATLIGRVWRPDVAGPSVVVYRDGRFIDITADAPTVSELCNAADPVAVVAGLAGEDLGDAAAIVANSGHAARDPGLPWLLAPCDLQPVKAAGVTFVTSMLERVIEEQTKGDPARAQEARKTVMDALGGDLRSVVPGSPEAARVKEVLLQRGLWSQYLEVGIGPDAEIFSKCPPMASVGVGAEIGIHPKSVWNNPEPEIVLVIANDGRIVGATLGNDVNLRDVEGRSALLLGRAKDNNASSAIGPLIRLCDDGFTLNDIRAANLTMSVTGTDGYELTGTSSMAEISRDISDLAAQTLSPHHQYPDGCVLFTGTLFAPVKDRDKPGEGFTHKAGDTVAIATPKLGSLVNTVTATDKAPPWSFGTGALMRNLAKRGLLRA